MLSSISAHMLLFCRVRSSGEPTEFHAAGKAPVLEYHKWTWHYSRGKKWLFFKKKLTVKQKCAKNWCELGQRKIHNILVIKSSWFGCVNDCTVQWQIPMTWLCSKSRPRPQVQCAALLFPKRINFKHEDIDCFGVVTVWGITAAALSLGSARGTALAAGLVPLCPVIVNDVVEPCDLN